MAKGTTTGAEKAPVAYAGIGTIDPWLSREFARVLELDEPLFRDPKEAKAAGHRDVLVPDGQMFLPTRAGEGEPPRAATGLPEGYNSVVTGLRTELLKPLEAGQPFTVRVRRMPDSLQPTARVKAFHQIEYELTDIDGDVAVRQWLTVAELAV